MAETGWHFHGEGLAWSNDRCKAQREGVWARPAVVLPLDGLEETIAREVGEHRHGGLVNSREGWVECMCDERLPCEFEGPPHHDPVWDDAAGGSSDDLAIRRHLTDRIARALAGDGAR